MPTQQNLANVTIAPAADTSILTKLGVVRLEIEAVATEVPADVADNLFRLADKRMMFDELCDTNMHQFPNTKPAEVDLPLYDADGDTLGKLTAYEVILTALLARVRGAKALHGSDRMDADLTYFNYLKFGQRTGMANAAAIHTAIAPHYPVGRRGNTPPTTPP